MSRKQLNIRISLETRRVLDWLKLDFEENEGAVVARALDRMYQEAMRRFDNPDPVTMQLIEEQDIALGEQVADEELPYFSSLGNDISTLADYFEDETS